MDITLILIVGLIIVVLCVYRRFSSFIYSLAIVDIFLRLITFLKYNLGIPEIQNFLSKYFPESIGAIITHYSSGLLETILLWLYFGFYCVFLYYIVVYFFKKKK